MSSEGPNQAITPNDPATAVVATNSLLAQQRSSFEVWFEGEFGYNPAPFWDDEGCFYGGPRDIQIFWYGFRAGWYDRMKFYTDGLINKSDSESHNYVLNDMGFWQEVGRQLALQRRANLEQKSTDGDIK